MDLVDLLNPFDDLVDVDRLLRYQHQVGLPVRRTQRQEPRLPAHHLHDRDTAMTFGRGPHALHAAGRNEDCRGVAGRDVIDHLLQIDHGARTGAGVAVSGGGFAGVANPFVDFIQVIQTQIVVDRLGSEHRGHSVTKRLQAIERAVAPDAHQPLHAQPPQSLEDFLDGLPVVRIDIVSRSAQNCSPLGRVELRNDVKQRIQVHVRNAQDSAGC